MLFRQSTVHGAAAGKFNSQRRARKWRLLLHPVAALVLVALATESSHAQNFVRVRVTSSAVNAAKDSLCTVDPRPAGASAAAHADSLQLEVFTDSSYGTPANTPVELLLLLDGAVRGSVLAGKSSTVVEMAGQELSGRTVALARGDRGAVVGKPFCARVPLPTPRTTIEIGGNHTSFVADGAVGTSLRTGQLSSGGLTGSLGIEHHSVKAAPERLPRLVGYVFGMGKIDGERLRSYITLASSSDSLTAGDRETFTQAILLPAFAGGQLGSALIDYHPYKKRGSGEGTEGGRVVLLVTRSRWHLTAPADSLTSEDLYFRASRSASVTTTSFDWRYNWAFIDHPQDSLGNNFRFAVELGATLRGVSVAGRHGRDFRRATLGVGQPLLYGALFGFEIQLRQVTATFDVPALVVRKEKGDPEPGALRPVKPVIGFRFDAPFFTF